MKPMKLYFSLTEAEEEATWNTSCDLSQKEHIMRYLYRLVNQLLVTKISANWNISMLQPKFVSLCI